MVFVNEPVQQDVQVPAMPMERKSTMKPSVFANSIEKKTAVMKSPEEKSARKKSREKATQKPPDEKLAAAETLNEKPPPVNEPAMPKPNGKI